MDLSSLPEFDGPAEQRGIGGIAGIVRQLSGLGALFAHVGGNRR
jgi:hypothetical protein